MQLSQIYMFDWCYAWSEFLEVGRLLLMSGWTTEIPLWVRNTKVNVLFTVMFFLFCPWLIYNLAEIIHRSYTTISGCFLPGSGRRGSAFPSHGWGSLVCSTMYFNPAIRGTRHINFRLSFFLLLYLSMLQLFWQTWMPYLVENLHRFWSSSMKWMMMEVSNRTSWITPHALVTLGYILHWPHSCPVNYRH